MMFFFLGTVAGGIPMMYQKARVQAFSWKLPVYVIGESLAVMLVSLFLRKRLAAAQEAREFWSLLRRVLLLP